MIERELPGAAVLFTTRRGGVSEGPYSSLNLGILTADEPDRVRRNREIVEARVQTPIAMGHQVHGTALKRWTEPAPGLKLERVDGHLTERHDLALMVLVADCLPVALSDGEQVAMLHCGWRGLAAGIVHQATAQLDGRPAAVVGPGIGRCCYEVGDEVLSAFADVPEAIDGRNLSLRSVAEARLRAAGVGSVDHVDLCSSCRPDLFFSHRRDNGVTGRQGGIVRKTS